MPDIEIIVPTNRPVERVKASIEAEIGSRLPGGRIQRFWEGDVYRLVGMGADGRIEVRPGEIRATASLKAPLSLMKARVEQGLRETIEKAAGEHAAGEYAGEHAAGEKAAGPDTQTTSGPTEGSGAPSADPRKDASDALGASGKSNTRSGSGDGNQLQADGRFLQPGGPDLAQMRSRIHGLVLPGASAHDEYLTNFGHIHHWRPRFVVKPASTEDVLAALRFARERGLTVSTRGAAHSQSQLAVNRDGILLDMKSMGKVLAIDPEAKTITVEPGAIWRDVVARAHHHGLAPPVLTNNLSVTVGGTLSMAGIGVASYRFGAQGDNVEEIEVATPDGTLHTCSAGQNSDLFWGVLSGLGQIGILVKAKLRLRPVRAMTRTYYLLYDDIRRFMADAKFAMDSERWDYLESWCSPCGQGLKWVGGVRQPFARWLYPFHFTVEYDPGSPPDDEKMLEGLRPYDNLLVDDLPTHDFFNRLVPLFDLWKKIGTWEHVHPWMEVILPWETSAEYIESVLADLSPGVSVGGHVLLWPARSSVSEVPLFMHPQSDYLIGFGILPAVPPRMWDSVRPRLEAASELAIAMGGKRYLSGFISFTPEQWREHYGEQWERFASLKKRFDPEGRLNPGFVAFG